MYVYKYVIHVSYNYAPAAWYPLRLIWNILIWNGELFFREKNAITEWQPNCFLKHLDVH